MSYVTDPVKIKVLLSKCPSLEAISANLKIEQQLLFKQGTGIVASYEEIMEAMALGCNPITGMPRSAPDPGGKMNGIVANYQKIFDAYQKIAGDEYGILLESIKSEIFIIDSVMKKISNAIKKISTEQRDVLTLKYWNKRTGKQIQDATRLSPDQYKSYHRTGIERLCAVTNIDIESYNFCMEQLDGKERQG